MVSKIIDLRKKPSARVSPPMRSLWGGGPPERREKKPMPLRARRRRVRAAIALLVFVALAASAYGVYWVSYLPQFNINTITVVGADKVAPQLIQTFVDTELHNGSYHFLSRSNIFLYPKEAIEKGIVAFFPRIKSAIVSRPSLFSQDLVVAVEERQAFARWCFAPENCYQMDDSGFIFALAPGRIGGQVGASSTAPSIFTQPYIFSGGIDGEPVGKIFIPGHLPGIIALLTILQQQVGVTPAGVTIESDQDFSVNFAEGFALKASFGEDTGTLARNLKLILSSEMLSGKESKLEYIDLRFGNRVFYKLKGEAQATSTAQ